MLRNHVKYLFLGVFCFIKSCCCFFYYPELAPKAQEKEVALKQAQIFSRPRPVKQIAIFPVIKDKDGKWLEYAQKHIWNPEETFSNKAEVIAPPGLTRQNAASTLKRSCDELILLEKLDDRTMVSRCKFKVTDGKISITDAQAIAMPANLQTKEYNVARGKIYKEFFGGFISNNAEAIDAFQRTNGHTDIRAPTIYYTDGQMTELAKMEGGIQYILPDAPRDLYRIENEEQKDVTKKLADLDKEANAKCAEYVKQFSSQTPPDTLPETAELLTVSGENDPKAKAALDEAKAALDENDRMIKEQIMQGLNALETGEKSTLVKPINYGNGHWTLLAAKKTGDRKIDIVYIDSMNGSIHDNGFKKLYIMLKIFKDKGYYVEYHELHIKQQYDGSTCGGFTMENAIQFAGLADWSQKSLEEFAKKLIKKEKEIRTKHADFIQPKLCGTDRDIEDFNLFPDTLNPNLKRVYCYFDQKKKELKISGFDLPDDLTGYTLLDPYNSNNRVMTEKGENEAGIKNLVLK